MTTSRSRAATRPARLKAEFEAEGYVFLENFFPAGEMEPLRRALDELSGSEKDERDWIFDDVSAPEGGARRVARAVGRLWMSSPAFLRHVRSPRLLAALEAILGPDLRFFSDTCFLKPPLGTARPWHRDFSYFSTDRHPTLNAFTFLDDSRADNGHLRIVPRSHRPNDRRTAPPDGSAILGQKPLIAKAGSLLLMDHFLLHSSGANASGSQRRAYSAFYGLPETRFMFTGKLVPSLRVKGRRRPAEGPDATPADFRRFYGSLQGCDAPGLAASKGARPA